MKETRRTVPAPDQAGCRPEADAPVVATVDTGAREEPSASARDPSRAAARESAITGSQRADTVPRRSTTASQRIPTAPRPVATGSQRVPTAPRRAVTVPRPAITGWQRPTMTPAGTAGSVRSSTRPQAFGVAAPAPEGVHYLHPGDTACAGQGERLETLLGSCVAVILTDPRRTVGAMCHIVHSLPAAGDRPESGAYGEVALERMGALLVGRGINPAMCDAWIFGGGNMFPDLFRRNHVGSNNSSWAREALLRLGVRIIGEQTGGNLYRRIAWTVGTGEPEVVAMSV